MMRITDNYIYLDAVLLKYSGLTVYGSPYVKHKFQIQKLIRLSHKFYFIEALNKFRFVFTNLL